MMIQAGILAAALFTAPVVVSDAPIHEPAAAPVLTLKDICCHNALGKLCPGKHQITVMHPYTCCPVTVCFCLPCGCHSIECEKGLCVERLRFRFKGLFNDVVIRFNKDGSVSVKE